MKLLIVLGTPLFHIAGLPPTSQKRGEWYWLVLIIGGGFQNENFFKGFF